MTIKAQSDEVHVSEQEAKLAGLEEARVPVGSPSWLPTRKWWAGLVGGVTPIVYSTIDTGAFDKPEKLATVSAVSALVLAYIWQNDPAPGGVPER